jgi:anti-sigma regulatory factor (Ser/Thr protein kinase)
MVEVDWYLDGADRASLTALRHEITAYLGRHAKVDCDLSDAELVIEEIVGNAVRHAGGSIWVSLSWLETSPTLTVRDLGPGFDPARLAAAAAAPLGVLDTGDPASSVDDSDLDRSGGGFQPVQPHLNLNLDPDLGVDGLAEGGRGLFLVTHLAPALEAEVRRGGGMAVTVELPVKKPAAVSYDPPRRTSGALPALSEARPEGGFGKESFLRALVVQLARAIELNAGPDAAAAAVAQVGIDVGGQMEQEYRVAQSIVGHLTPDQLAHCYVRLKHAIDGGFYVIEATHERIVLGNRRCPFGDVVQLAPSLCRMTSSVFGGIAARNNGDGAAVLLEERIAVGDPGCRVVVYLHEPPACTRPLTHQYSGQDDH